MGHTHVCKECGDTAPEIAAKYIQLEEENARLAGRVEELEEALETARCALESPTFPSLKGSETVKAVRAALRAPTAPREAAPSTVKGPTNSGTNSGTTPTSEECAK